MTDQVKAIHALFMEVTQVMCLEYLKLADRFGCAELAHAGLKSKLGTYKIDWNLKLAQPLAKIIAERQGLIQICRGLHGIVKELVPEAEQSPELKQRLEQVITLLDKIDQGG